MPYPAPREPSALGPRRLIAYVRKADLRRPGVLIYNTPCAQSPGPPVTLTAWLLERQRQQPQCARQPGLHPSRHSLTSLELKTKLGGVASEAEAYNHASKALPPNRLRLALARFNIKPDGPLKNSTR